MSERVNLGKVAMTLGGDYSSSQSYDKLTCVYYDGSSWVSRKAVPEGVAPTAANSAYWQKISDRGAQGATGAPGQSYVDKSLVPIVDNLTTGGSANVLSAEQGKVLDSKVTDLSEKIDYETVRLEGYAEEVANGVEEKMGRKLTELESEVGIFKTYNVVAETNHSSEIEQIIVNIPQGETFKLQYKTDIAGFIFSPYFYFTDGQREEKTIVAKEEEGVVTYAASKDIVAVGIYWDSKNATTNGILECRVITDATIEPRVAELEERVSDIEKNGGGGGSSVSGITDVDVSVDDTSENPRAEANISGTKLQINFYGLKGETGPQGEQGPKGDKGDGVEFSITKVSSISQMTDITKLYALNGEVYRFEGGVNEVDVAVASEGGEIPLFTNLYKKEDVEINKRVSTSSTSAMNGAMLTNWLDIPMNHGVANPILRIKGLPNPATFGTHDYDRFFYKKNGAEYRNDKGEWILTYLKSDPSAYIKEVLDDGTVVLTMLGGGMPNWWGYNIGSEVYQPRISLQDINGDGSALTEAPDLIITLNEEIKYGSADDPSEPTNKGRWVNTHIKYDEDASQMILDNLGELQGYQQIPTYWESEMVDTIEKVQRLKKDAGNAAISFAWCSDAHVMLNSAEGDTSHLGELMWKAIKDTNTPLAISTGDEQSGASLETKELLMQNFAEMKRHFAPIWGKPEFIALLGNHDGAYGEPDESGLYYQRQLPPAEMFYEYFEEQILDFRRVFSTDGSYFYIDTPQKVRFICLNTNYAGENPQVDDEGFAVNDRFNKACLGQAQYDWLINDALKMPTDEWSCIIASHFAPVKTGNLEIGVGSNPAYNYSDAFKDRGVLAGVLNAFTAKTAYQGSYTAGVDGWNNVSVNCDFSAYKGNIICYIAGHWHRDLTENKTLNGVPIVLITSARDDRDTSLPSRTDGTDQETAFDVVVINRKTRKIQCVRCGAGEDRTISY